MQIPNNIEVYRGLNKVESRLKEEITSDTYRLRGIKMTFRSPELAELNPDLRAFQNNDRKKTLASPDSLDLPMSETASAVFILIEKMVHTQFSISFHHLSRPLF
jgi:hypothetical protein